ncbi:hypothetical protein LUZ60_008007 [Juncus effusus]|nr:hypothetical protein LUZ60_008007 [Juncus effusus]
MERRRDPFSQNSNTAQMDTDLSSYLSLNFDHYDQTQLDHYESALSSMVSSPSSQPPAQTDSLILRELIGRLGTICNNNSNAREIHSANTSSYSTPLNSPPKLGTNSLVQTVPGLNSSFGPDLKRMPSFGTAGHLSRVSSSQSLMDVGLTNGAQLEENGANNSNNNNSNSNGRKRKASAKGKGKETHLASCSNAPNSKISDEDSSVKRCKPDCEGGAEVKNISSEKNNNGENSKKETDNDNTPEPPKDYIHVRARRGQATDSHSLAERVRREKISERMKLLQDLVPGCNKVTGKAVMLDEIINYVQSLQRQVEFLSMKLATVNTQLDFNMDNILPKDVAQACGGSMQQQNYPSSSFPDPQMGPLNSGLTNNSVPNLGMQIPPNSLPLDAFTDPNFQTGGIWDDLQSVVQMGFVQGQEAVLSSQSYHGPGPSSSNAKI